MIYTTSACFHSIRNIGFIETKSRPAERNDEMEPEIGREGMDGSGEF
jgi:hypothetical protein